MRSALSILLSDTTRSFVHHLATASSVGVLFAMVLFFLEPMWFFKGRYYMLGATRIQIAAFYAAVGLGLGLLVGLLTFVALSVIRSRWRPRRVLPVYVFAFVYLTFAVMMRALVIYVSLPLSKLWVAAIVLITAVPLAALTMFVFRLVYQGRTTVHSTNKGTIGMTFIVLVLVIGLNVWGTRQSRWLPKTPGTQMDKPHIVLIVLDALRYDHLSCYGYERETSPKLDRLAGEGVVFDRAYSHGPRTEYAMPALVTSLYPAFHTMVRFGETAVALPGSRTTLAEVLKSNGYRTACVVTNPCVSEEFNMTQGFDITEQFGTGKYRLGLYWLSQKLGLLKCLPAAIHSKPNAAEVTNRAIQWLERLDGAPVFLFVHYMDTHCPYTPPPAYEKLFLDVKDALGPLEIFRKTMPYRSERKTPDEDTLAILKSYYDACIRYADDEINRLVDRVRRISETRECIVIITADHGDEFLEHGLLYHSNFAYEELVHVPLILWDPKRYPGGMRVEALVRHIDVLPTLTDILGIEKPEEAMGRSIEPLILGEERDFGSESFAQGISNTALIHGYWKAIYVDSTDTYYLYDLAGDPDETSNLWTEESTLMIELRDRLDLYLDEATAIRSRTLRVLDPETIKRLKSLGYL